MTEYGANVAFPIGYVPLNGFDISDMMHADIVACSQNQYE